MTEGKGINGFWKPVAAGLVLLAVPAFLQAYNFISAGPRYTRGDADGDNRIHNRRLCELEMAVFDEARGECQ